MSVFVAASRVVTLLLGSATEAAIAEAGHAAGIIADALLKLSAP